MGKILGKAHLRGLKSRWLRSGILLTIAIVVLFTLAFSLGARSYYYSAVRTGMTAKAQSASNFFTGYISRTYSQYTRAPTATPTALRTRISWSCSSSTPTAWWRCPATASPPAPWPTPRT